MFLIFKNLEDEQGGTMLIQLIAFYQYKYLQSEVIQSKNLQKVVLRKKMYYARPDINLRVSSIKQD